MQLVVWSFASKDFDVVLRSCCVDSSPPRYSAILCRCTLENVSLRKSPRFSANCQQNRGVAHIIPDTLVLCVNRHTTPPVTPHIILAQPLAHTCSWNHYEYIDVYMYIYIYIYVYIFCTFIDMQMRVST